MAVKLFCGKCKEYMQDVTPAEAGKLIGNEICKPCKDHVDTGLAEFNAAAKKSKGKVDTFVNKVVLELEEIKRRYLDI